MTGVGQDLEAVPGSSLSHALVMIEVTPRDGQGTSWLPGLRGRNARYVVTNISRKEVGARDLYLTWYCARGDMENRIKDQSAVAVLRPYLGPHPDGQPAAHVLLGLRRRPRRHRAPGRSQGHSLCPLAGRHHPLPAAPACRQGHKDGATGIAYGWPRPSPCRMCSPARWSTCGPRPRRHPGSSRTIPSQTDARVLRRHRERRARRTPRRAPERHESAFDPISLPK